MWRPSQLGTFRGYLICRVPIDCRWGSLKEASDNELNETATGQTYFGFQMKRNRAALRETNKTVDILERRTDLDYRKNLTDDSVSRPSGACAEKHYIVLDDQEQELYRCPVCRRKFQNESQKAEHIAVCTRLEENFPKKGASRYVCQLCSAEIDDKDVQNHIIEKHSAMSVLKGPPKKIVASKADGGLPLPYFKQKSCPLVLVPPEVEYECSHCGIHLDKKHIATHAKLHKVEKLSFTKIKGKNPAILIDAKLLNNLHTIEPINMPGSSRGKPDDPKTLKVIKPKSRGSGKPSTTTTKTKKQTKADPSKTRESQIVKTTKKLKCTVCSNEFSSRNELNQHKQLEHDERFPCDICGKVYKSLSFRDSHMALHGKPRVAKKFSCNICNKSLANRTSLKTHIFTIHSTARPYKCNFCDAAFNLKSSQKKHIQRTHSSDIQAPVKSVICETCGKAFSSVQIFNQHKKIHSGERPFVCDVCSKSFIKKDALREHKRGVHKIEPANATFKCSECTRAFVRQHLLDTHMREHTGTTPFTCEKCKRPFTSVKGLRVHLTMGFCSENEMEKYGDTDRLSVQKQKQRKFREWCKSRPRNEVCTLCDMRFLFASQLKLHHQMKHSNERRFSCEICKRSFKVKAALDLHMDVHLDIKRYLCTICPKRFRRAPHLIVHMRTHTGEKPYVCGICDRGFAQRGDCKKHIGTHGKEFNSNDQNMIVVKR